MPTTRTESIKTVIHLKDGEEISDITYEDGAIHVVISERPQENNGKAGKRFLETSRKVAKMKPDDSIWTDPDPRLRRILDR